MEGHPLLLRLYERHDRIAGRHELSLAAQDLVHLSLNRGREGDILGVRLHLGQGVLRLLDQRLRARALLGARPGLAHALLRHRRPVVLDERLVLDLRLLELLLGDGAFLQGVARTIDGRFGEVHLLFRGGDGGAKLLFLLGADRVLRDVLFTLRRRDDRLGLTPLGADHVVFELQEELSGHHLVARFHEHLFHAGGNPRRHVDFDGFDLADDVLFGARGLGARGDHKQDQDYPHSALRYSSRYSETWPAAEYSSMSLRLNSSFNS